jgi:hypothetical protein
MQYALHLSAFRMPPVYPVLSRQAFLLFGGHGLRQTRRLRNKSLISQKAPQKCSSITSASTPIRAKAQTESSFLSFPFVPKMFLPEPWLDVCWERLR